MIFLLASGCGGAAKSIIDADGDPSSAVTSSWSPPESPGLPSSSVPGGPGGGGGEMPPKQH
jgi:hypothetical protein